MAEIITTNGELKFKKFSFVVTLDIYADTDTILNMETQRASYSLTHMTLSQAKKVMDALEKIMIPE